MHVTYQQSKGRWNPDYWTAIFWFGSDDKHFFNRKDKSACNWMPKHDEIELMLESLLQVEGADKRDILKERFLTAIEKGHKSESKFNQ